MRWFFLFSSLAILGCGSGAKHNEDPVNVSGTVTLGGQPLSNVVLKFQPTTAGYETPVTVADGKFSVSMIPGKYAYFIAEGGDAKTYEGLPTEVREASLDRQVDVSSSTSSLDIAF